MSGFAGFFDTDGTVKEDRYSWMALVRRMAQRISHRGSGGRNTHISYDCALASVGAESNAQAYTLTKNNYRYHIVLDGTITNYDKLRRDLTALGSHFEGNTAAELVLKTYLCFQKQCAEKLEGSFSFVIDDGVSRTLFLCRDRFGVKPLFYTLTGGRLVFASEIKALFEYPGIRPILDSSGLRELFGFGGVRRPGSGVFENISEIKPGHYAEYDRNGLRQYAYWRLQAKPFSDTSENAVKTLKKLTAKPAAAYADCDAVVQLENKAEKAIPFTASGKDDPPQVIRFLTETAIARDLPTFGQFHLDLFSRFSCAARLCTHTLSAADAAEVFSFPPRFDHTLRTSVLQSSLAADLDIPSYIHETTEDMLRFCPILRGESAKNRRFRQQKFLSFYHLLPSTLECVDRYSMYCGLHTETPFADRELAEYIFNLPHGLLDCSALTSALTSHSIPPKRKTTALPMTAVREKLAAILADSGQPINRLIDREKAEALLHTESHENTELLLWLLQLSLWINHYKIRIIL